MIIAFEGPDNTGKSTSAMNIGHLVGVEAYNMTKENHAEVAALMAREKGLVHAFDRVDWLTHLAYRLALPNKEWNDARVRTVFAAPDTHLVLKLHHPDLVPTSDEEEGYGDGDPARVNTAYMHLASMLIEMNVTGSLFKSISVFQVNNLSDGTFLHQMMEFHSPAFPFGSIATPLVRDDASLVDFLQYVDQQS